VQLTFITETLKLLAKSCAKFYSLFIIAATARSLEKVNLKVETGLSVKLHNNNNNDRLTAFDPGQPG